MTDDDTQMAEAMRVMALQAHLNPLFDAAATLFGERLTDAYFDGPRVHLTVLDLDDADRAAILSAARSHGIDEAAVAIQPADPAALEAWARLRRDLDELRDMRPRLFLMIPSTRQQFCHPPFNIQLKAEALSTAERLHRKYGQWVTLRVGVLPYPPTPGTQPYEEGVPAEPADPRELRTELEGALVIKSGQNSVHEVKVTNLSNRPLEVHTNGEITAQIVDPETGKTIGGYAGFQNLPLLVFTAAPGKSVRIPLLVGTASFQPELGYTVPPGTWGLVAPLHLGDGRRVVGEPMPVTITD